MERYVLDTNIAVHFTRNNKIWEYLVNNYLSNGLRYQSVISFATKAEAISFSKANNWGKEKNLRLQDFFKQSNLIESNYSKLAEAYVNIDLYSRNKHKSVSLPKHYTARNMGKHDIWIAATAMTLKIPLISTDRDFEHLDGIFIDFIYVDVAEILNL